MQHPFLWAFLGAILLAGIYGRTTLLHLGDGVIGGNGDGFENLWNNWWVKTSLLDLHRSPYFTDYIYYPTGVSLRYHTLNPFDGLVTLPFSLTFGFVPTLNLFFLFSLVFSLFCAFLLLRDLVGDPWAAFGGAAIYTYANEHVVAFFSQGQSEKLSMEWLPLYLFFMLRALHGRPVRAGGAVIERDSARWPVYLVLSVAVLVVMSLVDWQYVLFAAFATALYLLFMLFTGRTYREKGVILGRLAAIGAIYAALVFPTLLIPMIREAAASPWLNVSEQAAWHSIDLAKLLRPGLGNPGYLVAIAGVVGLWSVRARGACERETAAFWGLAVMSFYLLSLGPTLQFTDHDTGISLPYSLLQALPVFSSGRNPGRFSLVALLGVGILAAFGLRELLYLLKSRLDRPGSAIASRRSRALPAALPAIAIALFLSISLGGFVSAAGNATVDPPDWPPFYKELAADKDNYAILELPLFTDLGLGEQHYQVFQVLHNKPRFSGRWARDHKLDDPNNFVKHSSLFRHLLFLGYGSEKLKDAYPSVDFLQRTDYRTQGVQILNYYKVRYIILYKDALQPPLFADYISLVGEILGPNASPYYVDDLMQVYRVDEAAPPKNPLTLDVGYGWFPAEISASNNIFRWADSADGQPSELYTMNLTHRPVQATLRFTAYTWRQPRTLQVALDGAEVASFSLTPEEGEKPFTVELTAPPGNNIITFNSPQPPQPTGQPHDARSLSFGMYGVLLEAHP